MFRESVFDLLDFDLDREMRRMNRDFERFLAQAREWSKEKPGPGVPLVWGYTFTQGPGGEPQLERFGNAPGAPALEGAWEPYASCQVDEKKRLAHVTMDLPGVEKKDIRVTVSDEDLVTLEAKGKDRSYAKAVRVGCPVLADSAKAKYNNGVLDITVELAKETKPRGRDVRVE